MSMKLDRWSISHAYNNLVKRDLAAPLTTDDGEVYILRSTKDYEPCYWLASNDSYITPGADFWLRMRDAIDQAELDSLGKSMLL